MSRFMQTVGAGLALVSVVITPIAVMAQSAPFIVIRFNQQRMYYEQPLYNAVAKAVSLKPEVMFDVVGVAPRSGNASVDGQWQQRSRANVQEVVNTLNALGVPSSRLNVTYTQQEGPRFDEVHISAR